jgi:uncharacterized OB-fold protein
LQDLRDYSDEMHPEGVYQSLLERGVFALHTCTSCDRAHYSPRVLCPFCGSDALAWRQSSGQGVVYSASTIASRDAEQYVVALVDLDEGVRLMTSECG